MTEYVAISTTACLEPHLPALQSARVLALGVEPSPQESLPGKIALATPGAPVFLIDCNTFLPRGQDALKQLLEGRAVKAFSYAQKVLPLFLALEIYPFPLFDANVAGQLLGHAQGTGMGDWVTLAQRLLGLNLHEFPGIIEEALTLLPLREALVARIREAELTKVARVEFACVMAIAQMEHVGIAFHRERLLELTQQMEQESATAAKELQGFLDDSEAQLGLDGAASFQDVNFESNQVILELLQAQ